MSQKFGNLVFLLGFKSKSYNKTIIQGKTLDIITICSFDVILVQNIKKH